MRLLSAASHALGLVLGLSLAWMPPTVTAADNADNKAMPVKFESADHVELHGTFYPSSKGKKAACVLLLHKIGSEEGWGDLPEELQKNDFAVLVLEFRGHGNSTAVGVDFWRQPVNTQLKGYNLAHPKDSISYKDFPANYLPVLVNDIAAAKLFLDRKNDAEECNSGNLILIGAEDGATLGTMWLATEQFLCKIGGAGMSLEPPDSKDVVGAVWLSMAQTLGKDPRLGVRPVNLSSLLTLAQRGNKKIPMAFLYGDGDKTGEKIAKALVKEQQGTGKNAQKMTGELAVDKAKTLAGQALLDKDLRVKLKDKDLSAPAWIAGDYLKQLTDTQNLNDWDKRDVEKSAYVWKYGVRPILAKQAGEKIMSPMPVDLLTAIAPR